MKLYAKRKAWSWRQNFDIYNAYDEVMYSAQGRPDWFGRRKVSLIDNQTGEEIAFLKQKNAAWTLTFEIYDGNQLELIIRRKMMSFKPRYLIEGTDWSVEGSAFSYNYTIRDGQNHTVAVISKKFFEWTDKFEIDIQDPNANIGHILCIVLAIHTDIQQSTVAATSSSS